jgi:Tfp pilus assembly protein PilX
MRVVVPVIMLGIMLTSAAIAARTVLVIMLLIMLVAMPILRLVPTHRRVFAHRHAPRWLRFGL